jgi:hypothetical protein
MFKESYDCKFKFYLKKLISEKEKWLGIGRIPFVLIILVLTLLIIIGFAGLISSAVLLITGS